MRRGFEIGVLVCALAGAVALSGCDHKRISLALPDLVSVEGLWLWRYEAGTDRFERECELRFYDVVTDEDGGNMLVYLQQCDGEMVGKQRRAVIRPEPAGGGVRLALRYVPLASEGLYRISSVGAAGESALSESTFAF